MINKFVFVFLLTFTFSLSTVTAQNDTVYVMKNGNVVGKYNVNTEIDSVIFYQQIIQSGDTMYVMKNGNVKGKYNINTQIDSVIFYNPQTQTGNTSNAVLKANIKTYYSLQNKIAAEFKATLSDTIIDEFAHSKRLLEWILQQPDVSEALMHSVYVFDVKHTNGLSGNIIFNPKPTDMRLMTRGAGGASDGRLQLLKTSADKKVITNKNVLVIVQYASDFYKPYASNCTECKHIQTLLDLFEYADIEFNVTVKVDEGLPAFLDLSDYGIIIISTHGTPTGLASGTDIFYTSRLVAFSDDVEVADINTNLASQLRDEELKLTSFWEYEKATQELNIRNASYELTFNFFQSLPVQFDNTVLIGNYCYSGIQNGIMGDILATKGLKSFYGYGYDNGWSYTVTNDLCWRSEDTIVTNLIARDTTGIAHLANNTIKLQDDLYWKEKMVNASMRKRFAEEYSIFGPQTLNHHLDKGYHFEECGDTITDSRDGQKYPTVCIGEQVWMAENLRYSGAGVCFNYVPSNCTNEGRLYSIFELINRKVSTESTIVQGLCPKGWHVPSEAEFNELIAYCGGTNAAVIKLRAKDWPIGPTPSNEFGFNLIPGRVGSYDPNSQSVRFGSSQPVQASLWTSSGTIRSNGDDSYKIFETKSTYNMRVTGTSQSQGTAFYAHCRCVKD
jgi:uncharacterized protein (TIGR02145 family)